MILDRSKAPEFKVPEDFELIAPSKATLSNGAKFFHISTPGLNAVKIEVVCKGQRASLPLVHTLVPSFTLQMVQEGTDTMEAEEIANFFDFYASEVHPMLSYGHEGLGLLSTKKHLDQVIPVFITLFTQATFPEDILEKRKSHRRLSLKLENEKTSSRAGKLFRQCLFGSTHPYGVDTKEKHIDIITPDLLNFYYKNLLWQDLEVFITGDFDSQELEKLESEFGKIPNRKGQDPVLLPKADSVQSIHEPRANAVQSSIRLGIMSIPNTHPDFIALNVFNTILGGYFGSRLIKNIREEKGHTYGIYSILSEIGESHYWIVSADVQKEYYQEVINEIYHEIEKLATEKVDEDELEVVRNYMIGQMLKQFSSSFNLMDSFKTVHHAHLDLSYFSKKLEFLKSFTADDILQMGQKYFQDRKLTEVVVG